MLFFKRFIFISLLISSSAFAETNLDILVNVFKATGTGVLCVNKNGYDSEYQFASQQADRLNSVISQFAAKIGQTERTAATFTVSGITSYFYDNAGSACVTVNRK